MFLFDDYSLKNKNDMAPFKGWKAVNHRKSETAKPLAEYKTFHQTIKYFLFVGQLFGILPVKGITRKSASSLQFSYTSKRFIYASLVVILFFGEAMVTVYWIVESDIKMEKMTFLIWVLTMTCITSNFMFLAKYWPKIMEEWNRIEDHIAIVSPKHYAKFQRYAYITMYGMLFMSTTEHILSFVKGYYYSQRCSNLSHTEAYFRQAFPAFYPLFPYCAIGGALLQVINIFMTFVWNFTDTFLTIISLGLTAQFEYFKIQLNIYKGKALTNSFWEQQRHYYMALTNLVYLIDKKISVIIVWSFFNNLYIVCVQLFKSFSHGDNLASTIYFWFSLSLVIIKTFMVSLSASRFHDESKKPIQVLRMIPAGCYFVEASRFSEQIQNQTVAFSGKKFFHITRSFILTVAGTIATYELVLMQLHVDVDFEKDPCPITSLSLKSKHPT